MTKFVCTICTNTVNVRYIKANVKKNVNNLISRLKMLLKVKIFASGYNLDYNDLKNSGRILVTLVVS